jgi:hypothetical protein
MAKAWARKEHAAGAESAASGVSLSGKLATITRSGGSRQETYNGHPLYTFSGDRGPANRRERRQRLRRNLACGDHLRRRGANIEPAEQRGAAATATDGRR